MQTTASAFATDMTYGGAEYLANKPSLPKPSVQTTASAFASDVTYGGANYLASGRGFAYRPSSFVMLFASYGRTHLYLGE